MTPLSYTSTDGFPELHMSRIINADFETTASRLFRWGVQRSGLFRVRPTHEVVETGAEVALSFGPWTFRCRVVDTFSAPSRCGFTYGTLPGHVERGVPVDHTTIYRWVQKYAPELDKQTRWYRQVPDWQASSWRVDETYIRVGGRWCYLYRAITAGGQTLDFYLSPKRNVAAAKRFLAKALRSNASAGYPRVINTDKAPSLARAIAELKSEGICPPTVEHRQVKYLNNILEGDHGRLKRILGPKGAFKNRTSAYRTLKGMEAMHSLRKGQGTMFAYGQPNPDAVIVNRVFETA